MTGILNLLMGTVRSAVVTDPYFEYTTLLLPGNGTNGAQNNTFLDGSTNSFAITRNGNTTQGTFSPFSQTGWGNYFNGTNAYLSTPSITIGSGDFTIEGWQYILPDGTDYGRFFSVNDFQTSPGLAISFNPSTFKFEVAVAPGSTLIASSGTFSYNTWYHIALVRSGGSITLYINGTSQGSASNSTSFSGVVYISAVYFASVIYYGASYTSNVRITTTAIVPPAGGPTAPLTAVTGTLLLTCQSNRFIDTNTQVAAKTITVNGSPTVVAFSPFNPTASWSAATYGGSGYFDGSGDSLSVANNTALQLTGEFTMEAWYYPLGFPGGGLYDCLLTTGDNSLSNAIAIYISSSGGIQLYNHVTNAAIFNTASGVVLNAWNHIAATRNSSNGVDLWLNGVSQGSTVTVSSSFTSTTPTRIGTSSTNQDCYGYIGSTRIVKGTAVYTSNFTPPTAPLTAITNTSLLLNFTNAGIFDATSKNDLETVGNAQISTAISAKWGSGSMYFDGNGDGLYRPNTDLLNLGTGNFTIEFWLNFSSKTGYQTIASFGYSPIASTGWLIQTGNGDGKAVFYSTTAPSTTTVIATDTGATVNTGQWYHVAIVRNAGTTTIYRDGTSVGSGSDSTNYSSSTAVFYTGGGSNTGFNNYYLNGYLQDVRITKGIARYTANFTAPTAAFPTL